MTISSTWTFEPAGPAVVGCGLDAERIDRFRAAEGVRGWPALFTEREIAHCEALDDPALGYCAAFCAKEALIKALSVSIDYRDCELLLTAPGCGNQVELSPSFYDEHGLCGVVAQVVLAGGDAECVVALCLFGPRHKNHSAGA